MKTKREALLEIAQDEAGQGFVEAAALYMGLDFHPDTPFLDYIDTDGNPEFTPEEARLLDGAMEIASDEFDVYKISIAAWEREGLTV